MRLRVGLCISSSIRLAMSYADLILLWWIGYPGQYASRAKLGASDKVPWL